MADSRQALIPLIIGVTGHRDIRAQDAPKLKAAAAAIFSELSRAYPHTPLILLTPLAEGADMIAAEAALEHGAQIVAPIPMPLAEYERDFADPAALELFRSFLGRCTTVIELPMLEYISVEDLRHDTQKRDAQRRVASAYIATRCELLIAMWDGVENNLAGGTSDTVRFKRDGFHTPFLNARDPLSPAEIGPVYHVITPRKINPEPEGTPFSIRKLYPAAQLHGMDSAEYYNDVFIKMNTFNADARQVMADRADAVQKNAGYLFPEDKAGMLTGEQKAIRQLFGIADTLAQSYQKRTRRALSVIFILALLSALAFDLYAHVFTDIPLVLGTFLLLLTAAYLWYRRAAWNEYERKHQDYRAVAEGLRVQFYWRLAGLRAIVSDYYLRKQLNILAWIRNAIQVTELSAVASNASGPAGAGAQENLNLVLKYWVDDQERYFRKSSGSSEHSLEKHELRINLLFTAGVICAVALLVLHITHAVEHQYLHYILTSTGILILFAAMHHAYTQKQAFAEHARQYEQMGRMFGIAAGLLREYLAEGNLDDARNILLELGTETLVENADWVVIHRDRPIEIPKG